MAEVYAGMVAWPGEMGSEIAHAYRQWLPGAPDEITAQLRFMTLPPLPDLPEPLRGKSLVDVTGAFIGDPAAGEELMRPLREIEGAVWDTWGVQPAPALRRLGMDPEEPVPGVGDSVTLGELTPAAVDAVVALSGAGADSPLMGVRVRQLGGAVGRAPRTRARCPSSAPSTSSSGSEPYSTRLPGPQSRATSTRSRRSSRRTQRAVASWYDPARHVRRQPAGGLIGTAG